MDNYEIRIAMRFDADDESHAIEQFLDAILGEIRGTASDRVAGAINYIKRGYSFPEPEGNAR